jgi:UDP-N-acetylglucosamine 2-epimerase (non-hydrolysing)
MDAGTFIMSGLKQERVLDAVAVTISQRKVNENVVDRIADYESRAVSKQLLRTVLSYTDYVNRTVWHKT